MATFISHSPEETLALGEEWGRKAERGWLVGLTGELGAGKTQLVKGIARGLGISSRVQSPTFALIHEYPNGRLPLTHIDLFRLDTPEQITAAGLEPCFCQPPGIAVIEWCERWPDFLHPSAPRAPPATCHDSVSSGSLQPAKPIAASTMKILAIEFSSDTRSVALVEAGRVLGAAETWRGRTPHSFALIEQVLREAGFEREHVDCLAVGLGPGSYTGIRAALALAQGWQVANGVLVLGISSMDCVAARAHAAGVRGLVHFLIDAQRNEFYCASGELHPEEPCLGPLRLIPLDEALRLQGRCLVVGQEWLKTFPEALSLCPDAVALGRLAAGRDNFVGANRLEPIYLRATNFVKAPPPRVIPSS